MPRRLNGTGGYIMSDKPHLNVLGADDDARIRRVQSSESELPDDLRAVADQLIDDAEHLRSRFPASQALSSFPEYASKRPTTIWLRAAAAVLLIGIGAGAGVLAERYLPTRGVAAVNPRADRRDPSPIEASTQAALPQNSAGVQEVSFDRDAPRPKLTEVEMLRIQLDAFEKVIRKLQDELTERQKSEAQTKQLVDLLRQEIDDLRRQLDSGDHAQVKQ